MNATQFFLKYNKKSLDYDGVYGAQCVDVIKAYFAEVLGFTPIQGNAIDYWRDLPGFQRITKTIFNAPNPGDIIVWDTSVNPNGHIAVCNWSRIFDVGVFEQNYPPGAPCHYRDASYKGVLGWLRPLPQLPKDTYHIAYLSDVDDLGPAVSFCNDKLQQFSGGRLSLSYRFNPIPRVDAPVGGLAQADCWKVVDANPVSEQGVVLGYHGTESVVWYHTESTDKGILYSGGQMTWPNETLLFEIKHQLIMYYNRHRGNRPYIENIDNYTGGEAIVQHQIQQLLPYLDVFML